MLPLLSPPLTAVAALALSQPALGPPPRPVLGPPPRAAMAALPAPTTWTAPLDGPLEVLRPFAPPPEGWLPGHRGVDLAAEVGSTVRAAGPGTVTWAAPLAGRGVVVVSHPDGRRTTYEPVAASVQVGDDIVAGDVLGVIDHGEVHCGGLPSCLHWGLRRGREGLDPMLLLRRGSARAAAAERPALSPRRRRRARR